MTIRDYIQNQVFARRLQGETLSDELKTRLERRYREIVAGLQEDAA